MWPLAVLMGNQIKGFFYKEMHGCLGRPKKSGRTNKMTVLPRWP